jgi:hypothetical protein
LSSAIPSAIHTAVSELASPPAGAAGVEANRYADQVAQDQKLMQIAQSSRNKTLLHLAHERHNNKQHQSMYKPRWLGASRNHTATKKSTKYSDHMASLKFSGRQQNPNFGTLTYSSQTKCERMAASSINDNLKEYK